jgi:hypothetical protein
MSNINPAVCHLHSVCTAKLFAISEVLKLWLGLACLGSGSKTIAAFLHFTKTWSCQLCAFLRYEQCAMRWELVDATVVRIDLMLFAFSVET